MARPAAYRHRKVQEEMKNPLLLKMKLKNKWEWHIGICNWINTFENPFKNTLRIRDVGEDFVFGHPQTCLFALGSQARMILFCSSSTLMVVPSTYKTWVGRFSSRCGTALKVFLCCLRTNRAGFCGVHSCLCQTLIRHEWGASFANVGRFFCQCGALLLPMWNCTQSLPILLENKTVRVWLPKADKQACGWPWTKSSPTRDIFKKS